MCVGTPVLLERIEGIVGHGLEKGVPLRIDLSLTPDARPGDWVLNFLGAARAVIDADEAAKIAAALDGLAALMAGGALGDAFADLESRPPQLPPHLQAALDAGQTQG